MSSKARRATVLPAPDSPVSTTTRVGAEWGSRLVMAVRAWWKRSARQPLQARGLAVHEDAGLVDALRFQHVAAHRGLDQHREVAAGRDRDGDLRHLDVQHLAPAGIAGEAHHRIDLAFAAGRLQV